jgi:metallo-beta-lactamase family protein
MSKKKDKNDKSDFKITCFHLDDEVTGSSFLVEVDGLHILLDMGGYQNQSRHLETIYKINKEKYSNLKFHELDYVILTSSHYDHCGMLGILGRLDIDFKGKVISTELTQEMIDIVLHDSAHIMKEESESYNKKNNKNLLPIYTKEDVDAVLGFLRGYGYNEKIKLNDRTYVELLPNGHLSGDSSILITYEKDDYVNKTLLYLGDHNYGKKYEKAFTKSWVPRNIKPTCVITESTYSGEKQIQENNIDKLERYIISEVIEKKNTLIIGAFAVHRSSELAYMLKVIYERNEIISSFDPPIYMCGNMMAKAHKTIGDPKYKTFYDEKWQDQEDLFNWDKIRMLDTFKSVQNKAVNQTPKILIASSGMFHAGFSQFLLSCYISQKNCSILFSGYQAIDTTGNKLVKQEHRTISIAGKQYTIRANILDRLHMSGHADDYGLRNIFKTINQHNLKKVLIVHGEDYKKEILKEELQDDLGESVSVIVPKSKQIIKV